MESRGVQCCADFQFLDRPLADHSAFPVYQGATSGDACLGIVAVSQGADFAIGERSLFEFPGAEERAFINEVEEEPASSVDVLCD